MTFNGRVVANRESDGTVVTCELQRIDDPTINQACAGINRITIHTYGMLPKTTLLCTLLRPIHKHFTCNRWNILCAI